MEYKQTSKIFGIISIIFVFLLLTFYVYDVDYIEQFKNVDLILLLISSLLAILLYILSGVQYAVILKSKSITFSKIDYLLFPITINLWSYIIPFQGSLIFSTIFFRNKYKCNINTGLSISLFLYSITLSFTGILTLLCLLLYKEVHILSVSIIILLIANPFLLVLFNKTKRLFDLTNKNFVSKLLIVLFGISENIAFFIKNWKLALELGFIKVIKTLLLGLWYWLISIKLGYNLDYLILLLLGVVAEVSLIVKITPDNLGINQLISGAVLGIMGFHPEWGVIISLVASTTTMFLIFTIGLYGNYLFFKELNILSVSGLIAEFNKFKIKKF